MSRVHEDFKKENYTIPIHTVGGSTRPDALSSTSGSAVIAISGSASVGTLSIFGTRYGSTAIKFEEMTINTTAGSTSTISDWTNIYGARMSKITGLEMSTVSCDISLVSVANTSHELASISSGSKSTKTQLYYLSGENVTLHNTTDLAGNLWYKPTAVLPTSNNSFRLNSGMIRDLIIGNPYPYLMLESDTGGASVQAIVHMN